MNLTYEEAFKQLETIVNKLQDENTSLDEAVELFKQGIELQKYCQTLLKNAEDKVAQIIDEDGNLKDFVHEKDE